jgi:hypothetical protein
MYTVADFTRIKRAGVNYALPDETIEILQRLAAVVGAEMPMLSKPSRPGKQGHEKVMADIKSGLNKLSDDTFRDVAPELLRSLQELDLAVGADLIMDTAAANGFYARLYAKLLVQCNDPVRLEERIARHADGVLAGDTSRRAFTVFLAQLALEKGLPDDVLVSLVTRFQDALEAGMMDAAARPLNEELAEHVIELAPWLPAARLNAMTKRMPKEFPGITFKVLFKYLDYQEKNTQKKIPRKL